MFVLIKEVVFVEWFRIRKIPVRIPRNFKLNSENSEKSSTNCSALLCDTPWSFYIINISSFWTFNASPNGFYIKGPVTSPA